MSIFGTSEVVAIESTAYSAVIKELDEGSDLFDDKSSTPKPVPGDAKKKYRGYVPWGDDNKLPYEILSSIKADVVMSQNKLFSTLTCYASGLKVTDKEGNELEEGDAHDFFIYNRMPKYLLEQVTDMKHFFFTISVIILSKDGSKIVGLYHKEATHSRFEKCDPKTGKIEHLFYANWEEDPKDDEVETIELLDLNNPLKDLMVRMGKLCNDEGKKQEPTKTRKFAIANMFPIPGTAYYPFAPYWSVFLSGWYDINRMIPKAKKANIKNSSQIKYHVEIHKNYWEELFKEEHITDPEKQLARVKKEKQNINRFLGGIENSGKLWISGYYTDPNGVETHYVRITKIDVSKQGGDWIEDSGEASGMVCYADNTHPSLVGAIPGKSTGSFSGSVQRELHTIKQAQEKPYHDIILEPLFILKHYNGWKDLKYDIPAIKLTTLDKGKDSEDVTMRDDSTGSATVKNGAKIGFCS